MTTTIQNLDDLQDRRIMMDRDVPPYGYAFVILVGLFMIFLLVWSTRTNRIYVSQNSGTVQASNKTYIMSSYSGTLTELYISEGSYVNEGDLVAHIKSTDLDMQQDNLESQLKIYQTQVDQYNKLLQCIQDDTNYFSETSAEDQPYYYQYETYKSQVEQKTFDASAYQAAGYSDAQIKTLMEQNQSEIQALYYSTMQSISQSITSAQSNVDNVQAQIDALNTGANDYYLYAPTSGVIHMDSPYKEGMVLFLGQIGGDIGGGLCQLSNLIFWMTLHTPLTVTERYRHSHDVFPDANRTQPFGSGATCAYPHRDLMIRNDTDRPYQLCLRVGETHLEGAWYSVEPPALRFRVLERDARIDQAAWGGYIRHNQLWREVYGLSGALLEEQYLCTNDAIMMYSPLLSAAPADGE